MSDTPDSKSSDPKSAPPVPAGTPAGAVTNPENPKVEPFAPTTLTFDNAQFRPGEFTPYLPPATQRPHEKTSTTFPPSADDTGIEEIGVDDLAGEVPLGLATTLPSGATTDQLPAMRAPQITAPSPDPAPPPAKLPITAPNPAAVATTPVAAQSAPVPAPPPSTPVVVAPAPSPAAPVPAALPAARLPPPRPTPAAPSALGKIAAVGSVAYLLGCLTVWLMLRSDGSPPLEPMPAVAIAHPAAAPTPEAPAIGPASAASTPTPPPADDVRVPDSASAPKHEHAAASGEHHHTAASTSNAAPAPAASPAPAPAAAAPTPAAAPSPVLKTYETATLAEAMQAAKQAKATALLGKFTDLMTAREHAEEARRAKDVAKESKSVDEAYQIDLAIDHGAGPYHHTLQADAVRLHLALGDQAAGQHQPAPAIAQYRQALVIEPGDTEAKKKLAALGQKP